LWQPQTIFRSGKFTCSTIALLLDSLKPEHIKPRLLGHWGTTPGLNFIYVHLNRIIKARDLNVIYIYGPGHGGPAMAANAFEGTYTEVYPSIGQDAEGMHRLFRQSSRAEFRATRRRKRGLDS
jgi:xylulose-5-phosphate/fructose-6-phosphate phosphoketolase